MTNYTRLNNLVGWIIFVIASAVYLLTIEPTTSLWDCGEYITTANKLEVGHPPGAPLFMMIGRLFSAFASPENAAMMVNAMSALSSSFTILFLFWSITMLSRKFAEKHYGKDLSKGSIIAIIGSGAIGALAYTFTDSFWFSAVEGEVYAMSSLFTAAVFWCILKWERVANEEHANRWLILIAYLIGLSIGVHLLNLLAIPAIAFVYYFKKHEYSHKGFVLTGILSIIILGAIQALVIPKSIQVAAWFERTFTNSFGMSFNSGTIVFGILLITLMVFAIKFTMSKGKVVWNTVVVSFMVILIGYSSFAMIVIRSNANTPLDENNPETLTSLLAYLNREQYGSWPILSGPYFNSPAEGYSDKSPTYMKAFVVEDGGKTHSFHTEFNAQKFIADNKLSAEIKHEYIVVKDGKNAEPKYDSKYTTIFPRMFEKDPGKIRRYKIWSGYDGSLSTGNPSKPLPALNIEGLPGADRLEQYNQLISMNDPQAIRIAQKIEEDGIFMPSFGENLQYFFDYQIGWMYWRYFMWNFSGRQNDVQGHGKGGASMLTEGNWLSGIDAIDAERLGNQAKIPSSIAGNPGYNKYFMIPLLIGLIGFFFQLIKAPKDWFVVMLLFLFTGFAIIIYLNQKPVEPRERDYAYAASFYAFSIWIGYGVFALYNIAKSITMKEILKVSGIGLATGIGILAIESSMGNGHAFSYSLIYLSALGGLISLIMTVVGKKKNEVLSAGLAILFCLPAPLLLAKENWDDHDRSNRYLARDMARTYLSSCEPNSILFSVGDNDTFPLWYVQEVEGFRTDVRVVNLSLLGADWHANQAKMKAYDSDPLPLSLPESAYRTGTRDAVLVSENKNKDVYFDAKTILKLVIDNKDTYSDPRLPQVKHRIPANKFFIPVNKENCLKYNIVDEKDKDKMQDSIKWAVTGGVWYRPDLIVFDLLANFNWERPIYFTSPSMGENSALNKYLVADGLVHRFTPIAQSGIDLDETYKHIMNDFQWGNLKGDITMDYYSTRQIGWLRRISLVTAQELLESGDSTKAEDIIDKCMTELPLKNVAMDEIVQNMGLIYMEAGEKEKGLELLKAGIKKSTEDLEYFLSFDEKHQMLAMYDFSDRAEQLGVMLPRIIYQFKLDESLMDEFGTNSALDKMRALAERYLRDQSNPNAQQILAQIPQPLLQQWFPELFERK